MTPSEQDLLALMGSGVTLDAIRAEAGFSATQFDTWWHQQIQSRLPHLTGSATCEVETGVEILRDKWGIPHIFAASEHDLFFGYGYVMSQDRLWQLDYFRRQAQGRLSEVMGPEVRPRATGDAITPLQRDTIARTIGFRRIARSNLKKLPEETLKRLQSFSDRINAARVAFGDRLPIEFSLLGYEPEKWIPLDSLCIWVEFQYYLTVRLPVIVLPEIARRTLGEGPLYEAFLTVEASDESILPPGSYAAERSGAERPGDVVGDPDGPAGSNNWVVAGRRSASGTPLLASDPHIAFNAVSCWYEAHLSGAGFNLAGAGYIGVPGVIFGRNERVAWGITNNICSQRDLYQEKTDSAHPDQFLYDGTWEQSRVTVERIAIKNGEPIDLQVRFSRNGPIVDDILPPLGRGTGPVSLRWIGATFCDEVTSLLAANRATTCDEFREAMRGWHAPTLSWVFADADDHIAYQCVGHIPVRENWNRGYRRGWDPEDQWTDLIPFDGMPTLSDPPEGWIRTANNRPAPDDYPYPLSGTWATGYRARRIRDVLEEKTVLTRDDCAQLQMDTYSHRAEEVIPPLLELLGTAEDSEVREALEVLRTWNRRMDPSEPGAAIFEIFFANWEQAVSRQRFQGEAIAPMAGASAGLSVQLLAEDRSGWFSDADRDESAAATLKDTLRDLSARLGPDMSSWSWGRIHTVHLAHCLSNLGDLGKLLDRGGQPVGGAGTTVCNTGYDPTYMAAMGANYRLVVEVGSDPAVLWSVDATGQSGHPGSPNYADQLPEWLASRRHAIPLDSARVLTEAQTKLLLQPPV